MVLTSPFFYFVVRLYFDHIFLEWKTRDFNHYNDFSMRFSYDVVQDCRKVNLTYQNLISIGFLNAIKVEILKFFRWQHHTTFKWIIATHQENFSKYYLD